MTNTHLKSNKNLGLPRAWQSMSQELMVLWVFRVEIRYTAMKKEIIIDNNHTLNYSTSDTESARKYQTKQTMCCEIRLPPTQNSQVVTYKNFFQTKNIYYILLGVIYRFSRIKWYFKRKDDVPRSHKKKKKSMFLEKKEG